MKRHRIRVPGTRSANLKADICRELFLPSARNDRLRSAATGALPVQTRCNVEVTGKFSNKLPSEVLTSLERHGRITACNEKAFLEPRLRKGNYITLNVHTLEQPALATTLNRHEHRQLGFQRLPFPSGATTGFGLRQMELETTLESDPRCTEGDGGKNRNQARTKTPPCIPLLAPQGFSLGSTICLCKKK